MALFCAHLVDNGAQSSTLKSYISAIKCTLKADNYEWDDNQVLLSTLTKACKITNDKLFCRLPIRKNLFENLLFELERKLSTQPYLCSLYKTIFCFSYYGLMRIGEVTESDHSVKACDVFLGENKDKIKIVLYSSKTHNRSTYPQQIKISSTAENDKLARKYSSQKSKFTFFCPFQITQEYIALREQLFAGKSENFFIFRDKSPVQPHHVRELLRDLLCRLGLEKEAHLFNCHSFRIGRCSDLMKAGIPVEVIKRLGRWKSNAIYKYLRS